MNKGESGTSSVEVISTAVALSRLQKITTKEQLANLLGVEYGKHLVYYLYRLHPNFLYRQFEVPKSGGGVRIISAPDPKFKHVQSRLSNILYSIYSPRQGAHGFLRGTNIYANADAHRRRRFVLNIDIESFYESINFGRVRGLLISPPYSLHLDVATLIAQICCFNGVLPQGAPTSPIISNMICGRMDSQLKALSKEFGAFYTRYADDITISSNSSKFPEEIASFHVEDERRVAQVGDRLREVVEGNGFSIKKQKTRLLTKSDRQIVTGLVVNRHPNVPRKYIRNLRGALHAWRAHGYAAAQAEFDARSQSTVRSGKTLERVLKGRIQYVGQIRGFEDGLYKKIRDQFNELAESKIKISPDRDNERISRANWIIEADDSTIQGTAFFLKGVGLVTCAHCLEDNPFIYHPSEPAKKFRVETVWSHPQLDLAVMKLTEGQDEISYQELKLQPLGAQIELRSEVTLAGYPNFAPGKSITIKDGKVQSFSVKSGQRIINISCGIVAGNSGGPVLNRYGRVIGVAFTGSDREETVDLTDEHGVVPISGLNDMVVE